MPASTRLLQKIKEAWGEDLTQDLVVWVNEAQAVNRAEMRGLADLYFARLATLVDERVAGREAVQVRLTLTIRNAGLVTVRYLPCNHVLLRRTETDWTIARRTFCNVASSSIELAPGESQTDTLAVGFGPHAEAGPPDAAFRLGTYVFRPDASQADFETTETFTLAQLTEAGVLPGAHHP